MTISRSLRRLLILPILVPLATGCASFRGEDRLLEPEYLTVSTTAGRTLLRGLAGFMESEGIRVVCFGNRFPSGPAADYQEVMTTRLRPFAPVVLDARECNEQSGEWTTKEDDEPALSFQMADASGGSTALRAGTATLTGGLGRFRWQTSDIATGYAAVTLPRGRSFGYTVRLQMEAEGPWYVDDVFCTPTGAMNFCVPVDPRVTGDGSGRGPDEVRDPR